MNTLLKFCNVFTDIDASQTSVTLDVHVIAKGNNDFLKLLGEFTGRRKNKGLGPLNGHVQLLKDGDGQCGGLACASLCPRNDVVAFYNGYNCALLKSGRPLETWRRPVQLYEEYRRRNKGLPVGVNPTEKLRFEIHIIKAIIIKSGHSTTYIDCKGNSSPVYDLVPIGFDLIVGNILKLFTEAEIYKQYVQQE